MKRRSRIHSPVMLSSDSSLVPSLRFSPWAWAKLLYLRDAGPTEVGGFGISRPGDLLFVEDVVLIQQSCSPATVAFDDTAVAEFFDDQIDAGRRPEEFGRIWIHTHPGNCAQPSRVDEETFERVFSRSDWAVMAILASGGQSYARLSFSVGPGSTIEIPVTVDFESTFPAAEPLIWQQEYAAAVSIKPEFNTHRIEPQFDPFPLFRGSALCRNLEHGEFDDRPIRTTAGFGPDDEDAERDGLRDWRWGDW